MATYTQTYTFSNGTTADGGQVNTEIVALGQSVNNIVNAQVDSAAAIAISKTTLGTYTAWATYSPSLYVSDNTSSGLSSITKARWMQVGKKVTVEFQLVCNATASFNDYMTLPVVPADISQEYNVGVGVMDISSPCTPMAINVFTTAGGRVHFAPYTATSFANKTISGTFSYEVA